MSYPYKGTMAGMANFPKDLPKRLADCDHDYQWQGDCGKVCTECGDHKGLARCFCGWPDGHGRQDLIDAGETIEPEDY